MFRMNKLSTAMVAAGLLSVSLLTAPPVANAQTVSTTGTGTAAIVPYYTVRDGWDTLMNITNTTGNSLVVKVRFRESYNSRDVLDFKVLLSPYDVWTAWLSNNGGRPFLQTNDRSCTVPISVRDNGEFTQRQAYTPPFGDAGPQDDERMLEGYVEVLVMGEVDGEGPAGQTPWLAKHVNGEPRNCAAAENNFIRGAGIPAWTGGPITGVDGSGDPAARGHYGPITHPAPLKVNVSYVKRASGLAAGTTAIHFSGWGVGQNLVTAQQFPWFLEPTLASHAGLWNNSALPDVEAALTASSVINEWSNNPNLGVQTDWVVVFPTKSFRVDRANTNIQAGCNQWRNNTGGGVIAGSCEQPLAPFENAFTGRSNITVTYTLYDREETPIEVTTDGVTISPAPPVPVEIDTLPFETNVLVIGNSTYGPLVSAFNSAVQQVVDIQGQFAGSEPEFGWVNLTFPRAGALPAAGLILKVRDFGDPMLNFGQAMDHAYRR